MSEPVLHTFLKRALLITPVIPIIVIPLIYFSNKNLDDKVNSVISIEVSPSNAQDVANSISGVLSENCLQTIKDKDPDKCRQFDSSYSRFSSEQIKKLGDHYLVADKFIQEEKSKKEEEARIARQKSIEDGSYMPSQSDLERPCKRMVEGNSLTGKVDWGWFNASWFPQQKTLILKGKTSNAFGVMIPFSAECRWEKGGNIRLVEITR